jgi:hypothetical protein
LGKAAASLTTGHAKQQTIPSFTTRSSRRTRTALKTDSVVEFGDEGSYMGSAGSGPSKAYAMHAITPRTSDVDDLGGINVRSEVKVDFGKA